jgi:plastocyanin
MTGTSAQIRRLLSPRHGILVCLSLLALVAACGSSGSGGSASSTTSAAAASSTTAATASGGTTAPGGATTSAAAAEITIKNFAFTTPASVSPGAKITVRNEDSTAHTVTVDSGNAFNDQAPSGSSSFTAPMTPGSYPFHCSIHPFMHGTLVVK